MQIDGCQPNGACAVNVGGTLYQFFQMDSNGLVTWGLNASPGTNSYFSFSRNPTTAPPSGVVKNFRVIDAADTARVASTEYINIHGNANVIRTWATGTLALQRDHLLSGGAIAFVGASTCTQAATLGIDTMPTAGTNCTLTDAYGILTAAAVHVGIGGQLKGNLSALQFGFLAFSWTATGDANATLTASQSANVILSLSGATLTATRNLIVTNPTAAGGIYIVKNATGGAQSVQIIGSSGTGITIATGKTAMVAWDGTNFIRLTADV
jgi:hypothetical protein